MAKSARSSYRPPLGAAARLQGRVIWALMLRELNARARGRDLAFLWTALESIVAISVLILAFRSFRQITPLGLDIAPFFTTGMLAYQASTRIANRGRRMQGARRGVTAYPQIASIDLLIARTLLDFLTMLITLFVLLCLIRLFDMGAWPYSWVSLLFDMALGAMLGFAFGMAVRGLTAFFRWMDAVANVAMRIMFIFSGVFFVPAQLPGDVVDYFMLNPILHITEFARFSYFGNFADRYGSITYVLWWIGGLMLFGLMLQRAARGQPDP